MATDNNNALITYGELCNLGHVISFSGTHNISNFDCEWKPDSNKVGNYAIIAIAYNDARENLSTPMLFFGNSTNEKRRIYVSISGRSYVECDVVITFNWTRPTFYIHSITRVDNNAEVTVTNYKHIGWLYVISEN